MFPPNRGRYGVCFHRTTTQEAEVKFLALAVMPVAIMAGCTNSTSNDIPLPMGAAPAPTASSPSAPAQAPARGTLTFTLDPTIDEAIGDVKATSITSAELLGVTGAKVADATIVGGQAVFTLENVEAGDHFIRVNGDSDDLVPTRIDDPTTAQTQKAGQKLRVSYIGPDGAPLYHIDTYSAGQAMAPVVAFSNGDPVPGEHAYIICAMATGKVETRVLGTAALLTSNACGMEHPMLAAPFDSWIINTTGFTHHGDVFTAEGAAACGQCHTSYATKPVSHDQVWTQGGWCFNCHYGTGGDLSGFVDPTR